MLLIQGVVHSSITTYFFQNITQKGLPERLNNNIILIIACTATVYLIFTPSYFIIIISGMLMSLHEFNKNYLISKGEMIKILLADLILSLSKIITIYAYVYRYDSDKTNIEMIFLYFMIPSCLFYIYNMIRHQSTEKIFTIIPYQKILRETCWSSGDNIIHSLNNYVHVIVIKLALGDVLLATYAALNSLFSIFNLFFSGLLQYYLPKLRSYHALGNKDYYTVKNQVFLIMTTLAIIVVTMSLTYTQKMIEVLYNENMYNLAAPYIALFAAFFFSKVLSQYQVFINKTQNRYKNIFKVKLSTFILTICAMPTLIIVHSELSTILAIQTVTMLTSIYLLNRIK